MAAYLRSVTGLARHYRRSPEQNSAPEVQDYLLFLHQPRGLSWPTCNTVRHGVRFFFRITLGVSGMKVVATATSSNRPGKPGWYFRVLNCASEKGLSSLTWGRLSDRVTPRSASSCAVHRLVMGAPRSECRVSVWGSMPCFRQGLLDELGGQR